MDGKKVVIIMFLVVIAIGVGTYILYLTTRPNDPADEGVVPNPMQEYQAIANRIVL